MPTVDWSEDKKRYEEYIESFPYKHTTLTAEQKRAIDDREQKNKRMALLEKIKQRNHYLRFGDVEVKSYGR